MYIDLEKTGVQFSIKPHKKVKILFKEISRGYEIVKSNLYDEVVGTAGYWSVDIYFRNKQIASSTKLLRMPAENDLEYEFKVAKMIEGLTGDTEIVRKYDY